MLTMNRTWPVCVAASMMASLLGCGGRQNLLLPPDGSDAGGATAATFGPIDLTQAPAELAMTCDDGIGTLAFDNPCLVGQNLGGGGSGIGGHEVECTLATAGHPITWSFLLPLSQVIAQPTEPISFPLPPGAIAGRPISVAGMSASVSGFVGAITFSRVDTTNRAFIAQLKGTMTWTEQSGSRFSCQIDSPFWGAPGAFE
jgi:hypothetical protein